MATKPPPTQASEAIAEKNRVKELSELQGRLRDRAREKAIERVNNAFSHVAALGGDKDTAKLAAELRDLLVQYLTPLIQRDLTAKLLEDLDQ